jgi:hypothetical protein
VILLAAGACKMDTPTLDQIRDSKLFDRRIKETPRQKVIRECQQETNHYRVECLLCHTTDKVEQITSPSDLALTKVGERARIMRKSPSFGLGKDCGDCHQSKFRLNRSAQKTFGPGGEKQSETQKELAPNP